MSTLHAKHMTADNTAAAHAQPYMEKYTNWRTTCFLQALFTTFGPSMVNQALYATRPCCAAHPLTRVDHSDRRSGSV